MIDGQVKHRKEAKLWLAGLKRRDVGKDISLLVQDIDHEKHSQVRGTTWGQGGTGKNKRENSRRATNVMGYQFDTTEPNDSEAN